MFKKGTVLLYPLKVHAVKSIVTQTITHEKVPQMFHCKAKWSRRNNDHAVSFRSALKSTVPLTKRWCLVLPQLVNSWTFPGAPLWALAVFCAALESQNTSIWKGPTKIICWLRFNLPLTRTPRSLSTKPLSCLLYPSLYRCIGLSHPRCRIWHFLLYNSMHLVTAQRSLFSTSLCKASLP